MKILIPIGILIIFCSACADGQTVPLPQTPTRNIIPENTALSTSTQPFSETPEPSLIQLPTLPPVEWKSIPVVPSGVSSRLVEVYQRGLASGNNPNHFSKIGDCQNITPYFLSAFGDVSKYRLGTQYASLQSTVDLFSDSWARKSMATHAGFNGATVLSPFWTLIPRPELCEKGEPPAACELRLFRPSIAIISMEEAWSGDIEKYDRYMRMIVEYVLSRDVVPIIATRAEMPDSKISINSIVVKIAYDYEIPLWNFGAATLSLPNYGLSEDGFHLSPGTVEGNYYFDDPARMELGWTWRNLTALQVIDAVYRALNDRP